MQYIVKITYKVLIITYLFEVFYILKIFSSMWQMIQRFTISMKHIDNLHNKITVNVSNLNIVEQRTIECN